MQLANKKGRAAKSTPAYSVPALDKALDVIEWLAKSSVPHSQTDLARALHRTPSKIFRTLVALEQRGYIAKDAISGKYHLTLKLYTIAHSHSPVDFFNSRGAPSDAGTRGANASVMPPDGSTWRRYPHYRQ